MCVCVCVCVCVYGYLMMCLQVAKSGGGVGAGNQVAYLWAQHLGTQYTDPAIPHHLIVHVDPQVVIVQ